MQRTKSGKLLSGLQSPGRRHGQAKKDKLKMLFQKSEPEIAPRRQSGVTAGDAVVTPRKIKTPKRQTAVTAGDGGVTPRNNNNQEDDPGSLRNNFRRSKSEKTEKIRRGWSRNHAVKKSIIEAQRRSLSDDGDDEDRGADFINIQSAGDAPVKIHSDSFPRKSSPPGFKHSISNGGDRETRHPALEVQVSSGASGSKLEKKISSGSTSARASPAVRNRTASKTVQSRSDSAVSNDSTGMPRVESQNYFLREKSRATSLQEPAHLAFASAGRGWGADVLCMLHNGLRREIRDMCYITGSMNKRKFFLGSEDFEQFLEWLTYLPEFYAALDKIKEEVIYNKLSKFGMEAELSGTLRRTTRRQYVKRVEIGFFSVIDDFSKGSMSFLPPGQRIDQLVNKVMLLAETIMEVVHSEEVMLPKYLDQFLCSDEHRSAIVEDIVHRIRDGENGHRHFIMLTRWFSDSKHPLLKAWRSIYVNNGGLIASQKFTKEYNAARVHFRENHSRIVRHFYESWNEFEKGGDFEETVALA